MTYWSVHYNNVSNESPALCTCMCLFSVWGNREAPSAGESHLDFFYPFLFCSNSIISLSLLGKLYLICFALFCFYPPIILLHCFYLSPCVRWEKTSNSDWADGDVALKKSARLCGRDLHPPRLSVILSQDLLFNTALHNLSKLLYRFGV